MACGLENEKRLRGNGCQWIAGVDEAGRGPLAGPVVAAAVVLPDEFDHPALNDSKKLSAALREKIFEEMTNTPGVVWAVGVCSTEDVDRLNILRATHEAMRSALKGLGMVPHHVLVDGLPVRDLGYPQTALVGGDAISFSIAAASVIAKVHRDRMMKEFDLQFPKYGFARHKGYGTPEHLSKLAEFGPCPIHRRSFGPVAQTQFAF